MRVRRDLILLLAALMLPVLSPPAFSQGEDLIPYRLLTWNDFPVNDQIGDSMSAHTQARLRYNYQPRYSRRGALVVAMVGAIEIQSGFDRSRSWRKSQFKSDPTELLAHEQGHLDLNEIRAVQLRQLKLSSYPVGMGATAQAAADDLRGKLKTFMDAQIAEIQQQHDRYDKETNHGRQAEPQKQWLDKIKQVREQLGMRR
jgi:hypothetical protein